MLCDAGSGVLELVISILIFRIIFGPFGVSLLWSGLSATDLACFQDSTDGVNTRTGLPLLSFKTGFCENNGVRKVFL